MPEKLHDCVRDVKKTGKSEDSSWAICNDSIKEEVNTALGIAGVGKKDDTTQEVAEAIGMQEGKTALGIAGVGEKFKEGYTALGIAGVGDKFKEDHHPLDTPDYEVPDPSLAESVSIPNSASAVSIGGKKIEEIINKQLLETQIGECPCKNKNRPKA